MIFINIGIIIPYTVYTKIKNWKEKTQVQDNNDPVMTKSKNWFFDVFDNILIVYKEKAYILILLFN